ncbi:MAG: response regulator, partial [Simkania sp.]|nr:response regulator [Simkania sp.]
MKEKKRILIADPSTALLDAVVTASAAKAYEIVVVRTGPACIKKLKDFEPDLVIIDLMIPHIHGIEILKTIKTNSRLISTGVIITSYHVMIQNYHAAIEGGADYFLVKPFEISQLFQLIERYFKGGLKPEPFTMKSGSIIEQNHCYHPIPSTLTSYLRFWGTRGSNPVSGPQYVRYGGNTSCLEIRHNQELIIIDAGSGIRELGDMIDVQDHHTIHLFISHT